MTSIDVLIADLSRLVGVESPSNDLAALHASATNLALLIEERTREPAKLVAGPAGPHVWWSGGGDPRVLILGHHDTVFPVGTVASRPFAVTNGRATGPGVFDMKAGIVQAIHAVAALQDSSGVEMIFTPDEEVGSASSRKLLEDRAVACGNVLVVEPAADGGALKIGRKGCGVFDITIRGRSAHAGLDPEKGVNALLEAAHQILTISAFADLTVGTTVTPTVVHSGDASNVVPDRATIRVDVRVASDAESKRVTELMSLLTPVTDGATIEVSGEVDRPPMRESASATLMPIIREAAPGIQGTTVGGGSDGNFTAALGVPTLDGLGAIGGGAHSDSEWVDVESMPQRVGLLYKILSRLL